MALPEGLPVFAGDIDAAYLAMAPARGGGAGRVDRITPKPFDDGRSAALVYAVTPASGRHAVKVFPRRSFRRAVSGSDRTEVASWSGGPTRGDAHVR